MVKNIFLRFSFLFLILQFLIEASWAEPQTKKLFILGDSLSEGYGVAKESSYPYLLEKILQANGKAWVVVNSSVSGSTTASAMSRLKWILNSKPDAIFLALGANDGLRGLKVADSKRNLVEAIRFIKEKKIKVFLGGLYMPPNYGESYTKEFKLMYQELAKSESVFLVPFLLKDVAGKSDLNLSDGIHPNEKGHKIISETVFQAIKDKL